MVVALYLSFEYTHMLLHLQSVHMREAISSCLVGVVISSLLLIYTLAMSIIIQSKKTLASRSSNLESKHISIIIRQAAPLQ